MLLTFRLAVFVHGVFGDRFRFSQTDCEDPKGTRLLFITQIVGLVFSGLVSSLCWAK